MRSEKLPERLAGSEWRVYLRRLRQRKRERKTREFCYQNTACARCGGIKFNLKKAVGVKKLAVICIECLRKTLIVYR